MQQHRNQQPAGGIPYPASQTHIGGGGAQPTPSLNFYNNQHIRQPEATLFEDSPDSSAFQISTTSHHIRQQQRLPSGYKHNSSRDQYPMQYAQSSGSSNLPMQRGASNDQQKHYQASPNLQTQHHQLFSFSSQSQQQQPYQAPLQRSLPTTYQDSNRRDANKQPSSRVPIVPVLSQNSVLRSPGYLSSQPPLHSFQSPLHYPAVQQEESGSLIDEAAHAQPALHHGPTEERLLQHPHSTDHATMILSEDERLLVDEQEEDVNAHHQQDDPNDVELIIMNLHTKMKNLENKYIDLANYYKNELVKTNKKQSEGSLQHNRSNRSPRIQENRRTETEGNVSERQTQEQPTTPGKDQTTILVTERQIMNELIVEKKRFEEDLKQVLQMKNFGGSSLSHNNQQSPNQTIDQSNPRGALLQDYKLNIPSKEQFQFLNQQLSEAIQEILGSLDITQKKALSYLSAKQNEMYQLATSRTYNLQPQAKNEALGLWYDAKTKVASLLGDLKTLINQKQSTIEGNLVSSKINSVRNNNNTSLLDQLEQATKKANSRDDDSLLKSIDESIKRELNSFKRKQEQHLKAVQKLRNSFRYKEGLIKDEQQKIQMLIKDLLRNGGSQQSSGMNSMEEVNRQNLQMNSRRGVAERYTSGERQNMHQQAMSPFERKIASYQKSAEKRKQTGERSGSRSRPTAQAPSSSGQNFYMMGGGYRGEHPVSSSHSSQQQLNNDPYSNLPQTLSGADFADTQEFKSIKNKLMQVENSFEDLQGKLLVRGQDSKDMDRQFDSMFNEIGKFVHVIDGLLQNYHLQQQQNATRNQDRNRSKNNRLDMSQASPGYNVYSPFSGGNSQANKDQDKKMNELAKNYDKTFAELRKATERYLNQRVENTKLKDEIQILQTQLDQAQSQINHLSSGGVGVPHSPIQDHGGKTSLRPSSRPKNDGTLSNNTSTSNLQRGNQNNILQRENDELKRRVRDLEKECFQLTYYQQEMQKRGSADQFANRENQDLRNRIEQLCLQVSQFLLSMRRLQRAVNNKDKEIQELKADFEKNKKLLEQMVKEIREREDQRKNNSTFTNTSNSYGQPVNMSMITEKRDQRFNSSQRQSQQQRNRSQAPSQNQTTPIVKGQPSNLSTIQQPSIQSATSRPKDQSENFADQSLTNLPPKKGVIRAKHNIQPVSTSKRAGQTPHDNSESMNLSNPDFGFSLQPPQSQDVNEQEQFNNLLEEIKSMSEESERLRRQITDLKTQNDQLTAQRNDIDAKANQKIAKLVRTHDIMKEKASQCERLVAEYKDAFYNFECGSYPLDQRTIARVKLDLLNKESKLVDQRPFANTFAKQSLHIQTENSGDGNSAQIDDLRQQVVQIIAQKEDDIDQQMFSLFEQLKAKEEHLADVERLFVEKLREVESSIVEISQDMIDTEAVQVEVASKRNQQQKKSKSSTNQHAKDLERSLEQVIGRIEDEKEDQLEQLSLLNDQLLEENKEYREQIRLLQRELESNQEMESIRAQFEEIHEENLHIQAQYREAMDEKESIKALNEQLKKLNDKIKKESNEQLKNKDANIDQYQKQLNEYEIMLNDSNKKLQSSQDQSSYLQSLLSSKDQLIQLQKQDFDTQISALTNNLNSVTLQLKVFQQSSDAPATSDEETILIETDPRSAALTYLKLLKPLQKEYQILQSNQDKLQMKFDELKEKNDELKVEARESAHEVMNMEGTIADLKEEKEKLLSQIEKITSEGNQGHNLKEQAVREEIESIYKEKLSFKEQEIEAVNSKLARISQSNIELKTKSERLQSSVNELQTENEQNRNRVQHLELELEMTKDTNEKDTEKLLEQLQIQSDSSTQYKALLDSAQSQITLSNQKLVKSEQNSNKTIEDLTNQLEQKNQNIFNLEKSIQTLTEDRDTLLNALKEQNSQEESQVQVLRAQTQQLKLKVDQKKAKLLTMKENHQKSLDEVISSSNQNIQNLQSDHLVEKTKLRKSLFLVTGLQRHFQNIMTEQTEAKIAQVKALFEQEMTQTQIKSTKERQFIQSFLLSVRKSLLSEIDQQQKKNKEQKEESKKQIEDLKRQEEENRIRKEQEILKLQSDQDSKMENQRLKLEGEIERLQKEQRELVLAMTEKQDMQTKELLSQKDSENQKIREHVEELKATIQTLNQEIAQKNQEMTNIQEENTELLKDLDDETKRSEELQDHYTQQEIQYKAQEKIITSLNNELNQIKTEKTSVQTEMSSLMKMFVEYKVDRQREKEAHDQQVQTLKEQLASLEKQYAEQLALQKQISDQELHSQACKLNEEHVQLIEQLNSQTQQNLSKLQNEHQIAINELQQKISSLHEDSSKLKTQLTEQEARLQEETNRQLQLLSKQHQEHIQSLNFKNQQTQEELEGQISIYESEIGDQNSKIAEQEADIQRLNMNIQELTLELEELRSSQKSSENEQIATLSAKLIALQDEKDSHLSQVTLLDQTTRDLQSKLQQKSNEVEAQGKDLDQLYQELEDKQNEFDRCKEEFDIQIREKDQALSDLNDKHQSQIEQLHNQLIQVQNERDTLFEAHRQLDLKIVDVQKEMALMLQDQKTIQKAQIVAQNIIESIEKDRSEEVIGEIGSQKLQYCKRVKYQDKVWILMFKNDHYFWIDQDKIPLEQLKSIKFSENITEKQESLKKKLEDLQREKEVLVKIQPQVVSTTPRSSQHSEQQQVSDFLHVKGLEMDLNTLRQDYQELQLINNTLQQTVVNQKIKINEIQDTIMQLTESDNTGNDTFNLVLSQKDDLKNKYHAQIELNHKLEIENEGLKKQVQELTEMSFAKAGFNSNQNPNNPSDNFNSLMNQSSIEHTSEDERQLQQRIVTLEDEIMSYKQNEQTLKEKLEKQNQSMKTSITTSGVKQKQVEEDAESFNHLKPIIIQFLQSIPLNANVKEDLLTVLFSMLNLTSKEKTDIQNARQKYTETQMKDTTKKGVFGMFKK